MVITIMIGVAITIMIAIIVTIMITTMIMIMITQQYQECRQPAPARPPLTLERDRLLAWE